MKKVRLQLLPKVVAGLYLAWSILIYFGTFGGDAHAWWPIFLYYIIWPVSWVGFAAENSLIPSSSPEWVFTLDDYIMGAYCIIVGTLWIWFLGRLVCLFVTWLFPIPPDTDA